MITTQCKNCGKFLEIPDQYRGQSGKCNGCGAAIHVPESNLKPVPAWKMGCLYAFLGVVLIGFIGSLFDKDRPSPQSNAPLAQVDPPPVVRAEAPAPPAVESTSVSFEEVRNNLLNTTSLQWDNYSESVIGKQVTWSGWVKESKQKLFGGYEVYVDMDPPGTPISVQDIYLEVSEAAARSLSINQQIRFSGTVTSINNVLGSCSVRISDATIF